MNNNVESLLGSVRKELSKARSLNAKLLADNYMMDIHKDEKIRLEKENESLRKEVNNLKKQLLNYKGKGVKNEAVVKKKFDKGRIIQAVVSATDNQEPEIA